MSSIDLFNLPDGFTLTDLEYAYRTKIASIQNNQTISDNDKKVFMKHVNDIYEKAKHQNMLNDVRRYRDFSKLYMNDIQWFNRPYSIISSIPKQFKDATTNFKSSGYVYKEKILPDGSSIVLSEKMENNNGVIVKDTKSYKRMKDGSIQQVNFNASDCFNDSSKCLSK